MPSFDKYDAQLAAAVGTGFAGYEFSDKHVSLLIELCAENVLEAIIQFEKLSSEHGAQWVKAHTLAKARFLTGTGPLQWVQALQLQPWVSRLSLANQLRPLRADGVRVEPKRADIQARSSSVGSVLLGVIDHGCPFANTQLLRKDRTTRVLSIWDQDNASEFDPLLSSVPEQFGYGAQVDRQQLNSLIAQSLSSEDELHAYQKLGYGSLAHQLTHGAHTLSLFAGAKLSRSVLEKSYAIEPELNSLSDVDKPSNASDIVFVQLPRRALLSPSATGMNRSILDGVKYILGQATSDTNRVVICIPYGSLQGPHDGSSLIEKALDGLVVHARRAFGLDVKLVFSSGNSADKKVYAHTSRTLPLLRVDAVFRTKLFWVAPPNLQANTSMDIWLKHPLSDVELKLTSPKGDVQSVKLSEVSDNEVRMLMHGGNQLGVMAIVNDTQNSQLNVLLQLLPTISSSNSYQISGRWTIELFSKNSSPLNAHFYLAWGGRNNGFGQRVFPTKLIAGSPDVVIPAHGTILGTACGQETYVVGGCTNAPSYSRAKYSDGGRPRGGSKVHATCLSVSEESSTLPGLACSGVRSSFNARVNGTSVAAPLAARLLADLGWVATVRHPANSRVDSQLPQQSQLDTGEAPIDIRQLWV